MKKAFVEEGNIVKTSEISSSLKNQKIDTKIDIIDKLENDLNNNQIEMQNNVTQRSSKRKDNE